ncbi:MAG: hypothetical protein JSW11_21250 [Candidatus Heimdallarchaeota archaeon]|nr:MAG: hypothetical protein JSW11_21250 [Candidatus Heimdallarchaeota archaeon]
MNDIQDQKRFNIRFADKSVWNDFKVDLKTTLQENEIRFQYSEKTPTFFVFYKSNMIKIRVIWEDEALLFILQAEKNLNSEQIAVCKDIYDLLILFEGELVDGISPYDW